MRPSPSGGAPVGVACGATDERDAGTADPISALPDAALLDWVRLHAAEVLAANGARVTPSVDRLSALLHHGDPWVYLLVAHARHLREPDDPVSRALVAAAQAMFRRSGNPVGVGLAIRMRATWALYGGHPDRAERLYRHAGRHLAADPAISLQALANQALAAYRLGDMATARDTAAHAVVAATAAHAVRALAMAQTYLGGLDIWAGSFDRADANLAAAEATYRLIPEPADRYELPITECLRAVVAAAWGERQRAETILDRAVDAATGIGDPWLSAATLTLRADVSARWNQGRSLRDADHAVRLLRPYGERSWSTWASVARAQALAIAGDPRTAAEEITEALAGSEAPPVELARFRTILGEILLRVDAGRAVPILADAADELVRLGAGYWAARARSLLARADPARASQHWSTARRTARRDRSGTQLFREPATVRVEMLGAVRVFVDDSEIRMPTRHALYATLALAAHAPDGVVAPVLAEWLWPDVDRQVAAHRLKTALWQVRRALGAAGGRLYRSVGRVVLDLGPGECDYLDAVAAARELLRSSDTDPGRGYALVELLENPLPATAEDDVWAAEVRDRSQALAARLENWLTQRR